MTNSFSTEKLVPRLLPIAGLVLAFLGLAGIFTFASCPPGATTCIPVYSLDLLAILAGIGAMALGIKLIRRHSDLH